MNRPRQLSARALAGYDSLSRIIVEWSLERGIAPPATAETVGAYIGEMSGFGSRASLPVAAVTIVKFHVDEGLESSCADSGVQRTLAEMADRKPPFTGRSKLLGLDCYLALRETALQ